MDAEQFRLFKQITIDFFAKLAPDEPPMVDAPYMQFGEPALLDYASLVRIRGACAGCLYLTSPVAMLEQLLAAHGESEVSERTLSDMCRELSNILSGNASRAFAGEWEISVPSSLGPADLPDLKLPPTSFVLPIRWRGASTLLVIALAAGPRGSA
jgi:hypothetical protein